MAERGATPGYLPEPTLPGYLPEPTLPGYLPEPTLPGWLAYRGRMLALSVLSGLLLVWSAIADLVLGETLYTTRNLALTLLLLVAWWRYRAQRWSSVAEEVGLARERIGSGLRWGAAAFAVIGAALLVGVLAADAVPPIAALLADERAAGFADDLLFVTLVRIPIGTAVFEEVAFRGVLLAAALRVLPTWRAVSVSSVVFGLWHIPPTIVALWINEVSAASVGGLAAIAGAVIATTIAGFGFAWLRVASGSLLAPVLAHCATNSLALLAAVHVQELW